MLNLKPFHIRIYSFFCLLLSPLTLIYTLVSNAGTSMFWRTLKVSPKIDYMNLYGLVTGKHHPEMVEMYLELNKESTNDTQTNR
jgi:hypothetical protein